MYLVGMPRHLKYLLLENGFSAQELAAWPGLAESVRSNTAGQRKMNDDLRSFIKCVVYTLLWLCAEPWTSIKKLDTSIRNSNEKQQ